MRTGFQYLFRSDEIPKYIAVLKDTDEISNLTKLKDSQRIT